MKIIQSFWSKPSFHSVQNYNNARKFGGWLNFKYFLISSAFSCLSIREQHKKISLYTDSNGSGLFIDLLNLPYDDVSLCLDELESEDHKLWILGKMMAIRLQSQPFIHVDNDVYLWQNFPGSDNSNFLIAQSKFPIWTEYKLSLNEIFANFSYIPECLQERPTASTMVANVGLIGGNDIDFFQEFCEISKNLLDKNRQHISLVDVGGFNQMLEEYLFTSLVRYKKREIFYLLENLKHDFPPSHLNFNLTPLVYKYIHLIGIHKQNQYACEQLELRLKYEFPEYYKKVREVVQGIQNSGDDEPLTTRQSNLLKALNIFYTHTLSEIEKMKFRFIPNNEILPARDFIGSDIQYLVKETSPSSGQTTFKMLPPFAYQDANHWLKFLVSPVNLNEIFEAIKSENNFNETDKAYQALKFNVLNAITGNIILTGVIEFV